MKKNRKVHNFSVTRKIDNVCKDYEPNFMLFMGKKCCNFSDIAVVCYRKALRHLTHFETLS